ncbi:MAG: phosphate/phosphite/phosphonate ABC transporter substrate-binding protein [Chloroflexi bacterium]|nr:phosphate/phosphite/phosphonate ABC transporter substrate-binding protein [Chloroflexota bacterium]
MIKRLWSVMLVFVLVATSALVGGCAGNAQVGTEDHPIQIYFVPSVEVSVIVESGDAIANFLEEQTGLKFEVKVPTTYSAVVEEMGAAEGDAIAFVPAMGYVLAADTYGAEVALATVRYGWGFYWAQYLVRCDSGLTSLADLEGKTWAYPDTSSTSGYLVPASYFAKEGIDPGDEIQAGGHPQSVIAVYEGQVDFATTFFSPPGNEGDWKIGDPPQPAGEIEVQTEGDTTRGFVGGLQIRDARSSLIGDYPDVLEKVCILAISDPIPNDTVSFSKGFPEDAKEKIVQALIDYAGTDEGQSVLANDEFYDITGFARVDDSNFDPIRDMITGLGLREEDILQ